MRASPAEVLADAQQRGFLGADPIERYLAHALAYVEELDDGAAGSFVDLGSGGGVPALVLAVARPASQWSLIERSRARADWLTRAVARLGLDDRVDVRHEPAEKTGRSALRGTASRVVARSFGPPAVVAECAAPLLVVGGRLVCSDLDETDARWPADGLAPLGLELVRRWARPEGRFVLLEQRAPCPDRFPRGPGTPTRRPLF
jgi:16S rRNA (guanine527-N7)-methyltransferase